LQRLSPRVLLAAAILVLGLGAVGITRMQASDASPNESPYASEADDSYSADPTPSQAAKQADAAKPRKPLTAALLDKLRLRELRQLRDYTKRQADTRLPARQRRAAARRISAIERAARARLRAQQRREAVIRDREARQRARDQAPPAPASSPADRPPAPSQPRPRPQTTTPSTPPANRDDAERSCLLDENTGQYICPH
jgi:hypothetical protein